MAMTRVQKCTSASQDEIKFDEAVRALLANNYRHCDIKRRVWDIVMKEGEKLPPVEVLYCTSYGGYSLSPELLAYCPSNHSDNDQWYYHSRHDPALLQDISDYGRHLWHKLSNIHDAMRTTRYWQLSRLLKGITQNRGIVELEKEFYPYLVTQAISFCNKMTDASGRGTSPPYSSNDSQTHGMADINLNAFAACYPSVWASHDFAARYFGYSIQFANFLLENNFTHYYVEDHELFDSVCYESFGLRGASTSHSKLDIAEVPALVDYWIHEYDGKEDVQY